MAAVRRQLRGVVLIELDRSLLDRAGTLAPADLRSLDAIHIAAALSIGTDLAELVTYDARMAAAARGQGLITISPV
jgi:predicted nucleic acid-binding protein